MYIKQLETFLLIAKTGSFIRTAEQLYLSQPAVTQQIQNLENELGFSLLVRSRHQIALTPAGERFLSGAQQMIDIYQNTLNDCSQIIKNTPDCTIHYVGNANLDILPGILKEFCALFPSTHIATQRISPGQAAGLLTDGSVRLLLTPEDLVDGQNKITFLPLYQAGYYCVMSDDHPLACFPELCVEQLAGCTFLIPEQKFCPSHMKSVLAYLETELPDFHQTVTKGTDDVFARLLYSHSVSIMPEYTCPRHPQLVSIPITLDKSVTFGIAYKDGLTPLEEKFIKHLCSAVSQDRNLV